MNYRERGVFYLRAMVFLFVFVIGVGLLFVPASYFDEGDSICLSVVFFDIECYACGMTRAIQHLIHFDFEAAYYYNKLSFIVLPLIIYLYVSEVIKFIKRYKNNANSKTNL